MLESASCGRGGFISFLITRSYFITLVRFFSRSCETYLFNSVWKQLTCPELQLWEMLSGRFNLKMPDLLPMRLWIVIVTQEVWKGLWPFASSTCKVGKFPSSTSQCKTRLVRKETFIPPLTKYLVPYCSSKQVDISIPLIFVDIVHLSFKLGITHVIYKQRGPSLMPIMMPHVVRGGSYNGASSPERLPDIPVIVELVCLFSVWMESCWLSMFSSGWWLLEASLWSLSSGMRRGLRSLLVSKATRGGGGVGGNHCLWAWGQCVVWTRSGKVGWLKSVHSFLSLTVCRHVKR